MNSQNLETVLRRLPPSRPCLITANTCLSVGDTLAKANDWRTRMEEAGGARVALYDLSPLELVIALIALDGYAAQILLLPASLDTATVNNLTELTGTTHILSAGQKQCQRISSGLHEKVSSTATNWILATSGTTGTPKLIEHQLATLSRTVRADTERGAHYVWGLLYDPNRFAGLQVVLQALFSGSTLVVPERIEFESQLNAVLSQPVNSLSATPTLWRKLLMDGRISSLPLKQLTLGGETADQIIIDALKKHFPNARIIHIYASTEAGTGFAVQDGLAGFPAAWLDDANRSPALRINTGQHLLIKPTILPKGPEIAARLDPDGYLDTQDLVCIENNRVLFMGRASGAINVGGNKVNPEWIENYIRSCDGVIDARVFAKKSSMMGQLVAAEIVANEGADLKATRQHIIQACKKHLASWEVPALITFVNQLKENAAGKKDRISS